ncbi:MAG TPA: methyltransferase domain-containing protein [Ktedonobacteraceae bacterium]|jgi:ubiquinone/menaquinone biosynthesis C-methylase UbiE|nr:methyltransferase domain-containing protein [Ktedonobacteraceae bacterium]
MEATLLANEMEAAYLEYRKACYYIIHRHAQERGLTAVLMTPRTADEISAEMNFLPERRNVLELLLKALVRFGTLTVEYESPDSPPRYQCTPGFLETPIVFDHELIARAIGKDKVEGLIHSQSYAGIIDTLYEKENRVASDFVASNMKLWNEFLQQPFYQYCRNQAIDFIAAPAGRVLDLAAGPGFGVMDIGQIVGEAGLVIGLERSHDFVCEALQRIQSFPQVHMMSCDLDQGLPFLRHAYFDGAMIVGAFHFLTQREQLLEHTALALKPGGRLAVAYTYMQSTSYDQELMDLRFLLREPPSQPVRRDELVASAAQYGFELEDESTMGCFGSYFFVKQQ